MVSIFSPNPTELEVEYGRAMDSLFGRFESFDMFENNYVNLFARLIQDSNELIDQEIQLESYDKKLSLNELLWKYEKNQIDDVKKTLSDADNEFASLNSTIQKAIELAESERELESLKSDYLETESKLQLLESDSNGLKMTNQTQMEMIRSIQNDDEKRMSRFNDSIILPIKIVETLAGIKVIDADSEQQSNESAGDRSFSRFEIMFLDIPDDCLNFEDNLSGNSLSSQIKLSVQLLDKYRAIHKKRRFQNFQPSNVKNMPNGLSVNNLSDFKAIYENIQTVMCAYLTKQEIEKAGKRFGLDWIEGSPVISILVDSKATKMASIVLPKYYPLCGTSMIKLTSMTGYENSAIKNFRIEKNLNSLVEWIERFIELYNTNQLE